MLRSAYLLAVAVMAFLPCCANAQEWTRFRGPNGLGESEAKTIPTTWTEADYNWRVKLPGAGQSSPVLWGDKIFLTSADPQSGERMTFALNAADGKELWIKKTPASAHHVHTQNSMASSTPAVDADHVYVAWATPEEYVLMALDHAGTQKWRINLGPFTSQHGFGTSPIVYKNLVIITNDQDGASFVIAVDTKTGATRWKMPRTTKSPQNASYTTPAIYTPKSGKDELILYSWAHGITSVDPLLGKVNWELPSAFARRPIGVPVFAAGLILGNCGDGGGNNYVLAVKPGNKTKPAEEAYKIDKATSPYVPSLVANGDLVFLWTDRGIVSCLDAKTGKSHWKERVGGNFSGSPIRVQDRIYGVSADGDVIVLAARDKFEKLATNSLGDTCRSTPAVADGRMYLRTETQLFSIGGKSAAK